MSTFQETGRPKVVLVGMLDSIHFARWIAQLDDLGMDFVITGTSPYRRIRPELVAFVEGHSNDFVIKEIFSTFSIFGRRVLPAVSFLVDRLIRDKLRGRLLSRLLNHEQPDLVHINELIVAGFPFETATKNLRVYPKRVWLTNYGSELVWRMRGRNAQQRARILLAKATHFSAECKRDANLAKSLGFQGEILPLVPVSGGLALSKMEESESRQVIALKGYQNSIGLGAEALKIVGEFCRQHPSLNLRIVAFASNLKTRLVAARLRSKGVSVVAIPKGKLSHADMMNLLQTSAVYVGASRSDGISTSAIEAMANGAIPIQTSSSCASEWFVDQQTGFSVNPDNLDEITRSLEHIYSPAFDSFEARLMNQDVIRQKASLAYVKDAARASYRKVIFGDDRNSQPATD